MTTNFKQWDESLTNLLTDVAYAANAMRADGATAGVFPSTLANKLFLQVANMSAGIAEMMSDKGYAVEDGSAGTVGHDFAALVAVLANLVTRADHPLFEIVANTTFYVATTGSDTTGDGSSGNPWATVTKALEYLKDFWIPDGVGVVIQCADGTYTSHPEIIVSHPCGERITITGEHSYNHTMSSVVSCAGSAGAYSMVIQLESVSNIAVNDYALVLAPTGGTKPGLAAGCHKVTNVDSGNNRVTLLNKELSPTNTPSGAVGCTVTFIKTIIPFAGTGYSGITVKDGATLGLLTKMVFANSSGGTSGGILALYNSMMNCQYCGIDGWGWGFKAQSASSLKLAHVAASGTAIANFNAESGGIIEANDHCAASGGVAKGFLAGSKGFINAEGSISAGNNTNYEASIGGSIYAPSATSWYGITTGFYAGIMALQYITGSSDTGSGTATSPAVNTIGNENSYIHQ